MKLAKYSNIIRNLTMIQLINNPINWYFNWNTKITFQNCQYLFICFGPIFKICKNIFIKNKNGKGNIENIIYAYNYRINSTSKPTKQEENKKLYDKLHKEKTNKFKSNLEMNICQACTYLKQKRRLITRYKKPCMKK